MVWQREESRHQHLHALVFPCARCFGDAHHRRAPGLGVFRHPGERVDHFHVMTHVLEQMDMVLYEDATRGVERDRIEQTHHEDLDENPSSIECLVNLC